MNLGDYEERNSKRLRSYVTAGNVIFPIDPVQLSGVQHGCDGRRIS